MKIHAARTVLVTLAIAACLAGAPPAHAPAPQAREVRLDSRNGWVPTPSDWWKCADPQGCSATIIVNGDTHVVRFSQGDEVSAEFVIDENSIATRAGSSRD